jgi:hypothetical protein
MSAEKEIVMEVWQQYQKISRSLNYNAKQKVRQLAPIYLQRTRAIQDSAALELAAMNMLKPLFPSISVEQNKILTFYLLGLVSTLDNAKEQVINKMDSLSEMGEMQFLKLQMIMDHKSKLMTALSNILKKISSTSDSTIQNIK